MKQSKEKPVYCTVNTDAGYSYHYRRGSYAYWIKYDGRRLCGSGVMKEPYIGKQRLGPYDAEMKAIINALTVLKKRKHPPIKGFVFNRDNINTKSGKGNELERMIKSLIKYFKNDYINRTGDIKMLTNHKYAQFRHVKAHSGTDTARQWVNDWLDKRCKEEFEKWKAKQSK